MADGQDILRPRGRGRGGGSSGGSGSGRGRGGGTNRANAPPADARRGRRGGFTSFYPMGDPSAAQPPPSRPNQQPPTGTSSLGWPAQTGNASKEAAAPEAHAGVSKLEATGIFGNTGISEEDIIDLLAEDPNLPDTPSKTDDTSIKEIQQIVNDAKNDEELLNRLKAQSEKARGDQTLMYRKQQLRRAVRPWINAGLLYKGPKRPSLFLEDGCRNPERPTKARTALTGPKPPVNKPPKVKPAKGDKSSTSTVNKPPAGGKPSSGGKGGKTSKGTGSSPLSGPPMTADNVDLQDPKPPTGTPSSGRRGVGWEQRNDLFEAAVMDAAGARFEATEDVIVLPTLPSSIDYDTDNWQ